MRSINGEWPPGMKSPENFDSAAVPGSAVSLGSSDASCESKTGCCIVGMLSHSAMACSYTASFGKYVDEFDLGSMIGGVPSGVVMVREYPAACSASAGSANCGHKRNSPTCFVVLMQLSS